MLTLRLRGPDEDRSENWMDIGREYTERWHHQMQIRDAVGADGLLQRRWLYPVLDLSGAGVPSKLSRASRRPWAPAVAFEVEAEGDNVWSVVREAPGWRVVRGRAPGEAASVRADADTAWKLLYNALATEAARRRVTIRGDRSLADPLLRSRSVMV